METGEAPRQDTHLRSAYGVSARALFAVLGAAIILVVLYELGSALWPVGWWSPFFAIIVGGSCWIGVKLLIASVVGADVRWTLGDGEMRFDRWSLLRQQTEIVRAGEVARTGIKTHEWDSRPDTFSVSIRLRSGQVVDTPEVDSKERAERLQTEIRSRLLVDPV